LRQRTNNEHENNLLRPACHSGFIRGQCGFLFILVHCPSKLRHFFRASL
jgi:hypothetical protein